VKYFLVGSEDIIKKKLSRNLKTLRLTIPNEFTIGWLHQLKKKYKSYNMKMSRINQENLIKTEKMTRKIQKKVAVLALFFDTF